MSPTLAAMAALSGRGTNATSSYVILHETGLMRDIRRPSPRLGQLRRGLWGGARPSPRFARFRGWGRSHLGARLVPRTDAAAVGSAAAPRLAARGTVIVARRQERHLHHNLILQMQKSLC